MRKLLAIVLSFVLYPAFADAQDAAAVPSERGVYLTVFRSPSTGLELRRAKLGINAGFYPTAISRDGETENVNFIRAGISYYLKASGSTFYVAPSLVFSLDDNWKNGALTELGYRAHLFGGVSGRLGAAVLTTLNGEVRVNPTGGLDIRLGGAR